MPGSGHDRSSYILIVVHDVAPPFRRALETIALTLAPLAGGCLTAAVVPCWHERMPSAGDREFCGFVRATFGEVLLHGYTHLTGRRADPLAWLTGSANEFSGLSREESARRLAAGQALMAEHYGAPAQGFVPPAWQRGPIDRHLLLGCGLAYCAGFSRVEPVRGLALPLATWSWDQGVIAPLGALGEYAGRAASALLRGAVACVVVHPADVARGYLPLAVRRVHALLAAGRRPALFADLLAGRSRESAR